MRKTSLPWLMLFSVITVTACSNNENGKEKKMETTDAGVQDTIKKSIPAEAAANISGTDIKISYHAPGVKGRVIWGGLVPYDQVWVTGAHMATALEVSRDFEAGGKKIAAGKYALFTIPGKEEWIVIINKNWNQHLADKYDEKEDIVRIQVKPETAAHTERLKYTISDSGNSSAIITVSWEKIKIAFYLKIYS